MSKQITPKELAEIVTNLLICPEMMGELDETWTYLSFMQEIGDVVANHCGGSSNGVSLPDFGPMDHANDSTLPLLSISPNDSLPSINGCVWAPYDPTGWEEKDFGDIEMGEPMSDERREQIKQKVRAVFG